MHQDLDHLKRLSIFHYITAALTALISSFSLIHVALGLMFLLSPERFTDDAAPSPAFFDWLFVVIGGSFVLCGWTMAVAMIIAGRYLKQRRNHSFCLVVAAISCLMVPSVKELFKIRPADALAV